MKPDINPNAVPLFNTRVRSGPLACGGSDSANTPTSPNTIAAKAGKLTTSPRMVKPINALSNTSVFLNVMPTAKFRCMNKATTQTVQKICDRPPKAA